MTTSAVMAPSHEAKFVRMLISISSRHCNSCPSTQVNPPLRSSFCNGKLLMWFELGGPALNPIMGVEYCESGTKDDGNSDGQFLPALYDPGTPISTMAE